jgi:hypothetical protein
MMPIKASKPQVIDTATQAGKSEEVIDLVAGDDQGEGEEKESIQFEKGAEDSSYAEEQAGSETGNNTWKQSMSGRHWGTNDGGKESKPSKGSKSVHFGDNVIVEGAERMAPSNEPDPVEASEAMVSSLEEALQSQQHASKEEAVAPTSGDQWRRGRPSASVG